MEPNLPSGLVIAAREQMQGRGRHSRTWLSGCGENLTFSLLWRGTCEPRRLPVASMAAAVAVADLLAAEGLNPVLKWPNDVLVNGRKICGILSEGLSGGVIVGIGLNVNMKSADHIDQPATSLLMEDGRRRGVEDVLEKLLKHLSVRMDEWAQGGFAVVRKSWEPRVASLGRQVMVRDGNRVCSGILVGFGEDGELLLRDSIGGISAVWAGDVSV